MARSLRKHENNTKVMCVFRFTASDQCVRLSEEKLHRIPYLSALVAHQKDFLPIQNENGEYVLNPPFYYNWFTATLHAINSEQAYTLFTELPKNANILGTIQLFDYLGLQPFELPFLGRTHLALCNSSKNDNEYDDTKCDRANLSETRNTAAKFAIAISKNEYDLSDPKTTNNIFRLIMIILSNVDVFSSRFRHHTLTIAKECCFQFFTKNRQNQLINTHQKIQKQRKLNSLMYLYADDDSLPDHFTNAFTGKTNYTSFLQDNNYYLRMHRPSLYSFFQLMKRFLSDLHFCVRWRLSPADQAKSLKERELKRKKNEALSARSKYFNTLPKRTHFDKFKHRSGSKAQKHR
jgi:hypothetical protein